MRTRLIVVLVGLAALLHSAASDAGMITLTNRADFTAAGGIAFATHFNDLIPGSVPNWPNGYDPGRPPFERGDVTYRNPTGYMLVFPFAEAAEKYLVPGFPGNGFRATPSAGGHYTMFGFDMGVGGNETIFVAVITSAATYIERDVHFADLTAGQSQFRGYVTTDGEYILDVVFGSCWTFYWNFGIGGCPDSSDFVVPHPGIANVAIGHTSIPEPATGGLLCLAVALRRLLAARRARMPFFR